jgi:hypothetical protein
MRIPLGGKIALALALLNGTQLSFAAPARPQDPAPPPNSEVYCSSNFGNPTEVDRSGFHLVPATLEDIARLRKAQPEISAGPFADGHSAFDHVDVYLTETKIDSPGAADATITVYARAAKGAKEWWFKLAPDRRDLPSFDFFDSTPGDSGANGGDSAEGSGEASGSEEGNPAPGAHGIRLGVKGQNIAVFKAQWTQHTVGASTFGDIGKILLLDFRTAPPAVMAAFQCVAAEGGGVCGVWDNGSAPTTTVACDWEASKADFLCTSTVGGDYTVALNHRYYLSSGADAPYTVKEGDPPNLSSFAASVTTDRNLAARQPDIPGLGPTTVLAQYSAPGTDDRAILLASRGRTSIEPRLFAVIVNPQGPTLVVEIVPQRLIDEPPGLSSGEVRSAPELEAGIIPAKINAAEKFADDAQPNFQVTTLETLPNVTAWQVVVKQGNQHEVLWLAAGRNPSSGRYVLSAVRLATEAQDYASCGSTRSQPFAARIKRPAGTLDAMLDVEPAHQFDVEGILQDTGDQGEPAVLCPAQVKIVWNDRWGLVREVTNPTCPDSTEPRIPSISDEGIISANPLTPQSENK